MQAEPSNQPSQVEPRTPTLLLPMADPVPDLPNAPAADEPVELAAVHATRRLAHSEQNLGPLATQQP